MQPDKLSPKNSQKLPWARDDRQQSAGNMDVKGCAPIRIENNVLLLEQKVAIAAERKVEGSDAK